MFDPLRIEVMARFAAAEAYFKESYALGRKGNSAQIAKGLAFVQMYAAYEYTVVTAVQAAVDAIMAHNHSINNLAPSLLALFLDPELQSLQDSTVKTAWEKRLKLLNRIFSSDVTAVNNTVLPIDGTHFRTSQLQLIFEVLGIKRLPVRRKRHLGRINDVVESRNAIAHGRDTAENIGRNHSRSDILQYFKQMESACLCFIATVKEHCADANKHRRS